VNVLRFLSCRPLILETRPSNQEKWCHRVRGGWLLPATGPDWVGECPGSRARPCLQIRIVTDKEESESNGSDIEMLHESGIPMRKNDGEG